MARQATRGVEAARDALRRADDALAAPLSREALRDDDGNADAWSVLGIALRRSDAAASEAALRRAIAATMRMSTRVFISAICCANTACTNAAG